VIDRAKQFSPFSPLKGFYSKILEKEKIVVPRHEMLEDKAQDLSQKLNLIKKGMMVKIIWYREGEYVKKEGMVSKIDNEREKLTVVKEDIFFTDIWDIELEENNPENIF